MIKKVDKNLLEIAERFDILCALQYYYHTENYEGSFDEYASEQLKGFLDNVQKESYVEDTYNHNAEPVEAGTTI